jgi:hypothetical protein
MHVFSFVRPYLLVVSVIWIEAQTARIIFLVANSLNIAVILVNATCFLNNLCFPLRLLKCILAVFVNFVAHF